MTSHSALAAIRDRIQVAIVSRVSTDPDATNRLRHRLADEQPTEVGLPILMPDDEPTQPLRRPRLD